MTDEDLHERVAALEETVAALQEELEVAANRDIPLLKGTIRASVNAEIDELGELPEAGRTFHRTFVSHAERLDAVEQRLAALGEVGAEKTSKEEKLAAIAAFATNKQGARSTTVAVTAAEIRGCVGVSRRYAYDLIDEAANELAAARVREPQTVQTSSGVKHKNKALLVDCEQVHTEVAGENQFTTQPTSEAASRTGESTTGETESD